MCCKENGDCLKAQVFQASEIAEKTVMPITSTILIAAKVWLSVGGEFITRTSP